jgi:hypothetical protein
MSNTKEIFTGLENLKTTLANIFNANGKKSPQKKGRILNTKFYGFFDDLEKLDDDLMEAPKSLNIKIELNSLKEALKDIIIIYNELSFKFLKRLIPTLMTFIDTLSRNIKNNFRIG